MDKEKFNRAIELNKKIEEYKSHKTALESCNIKYGGGLIFTYNRMHNDVPLDENCDHIEIRKILNESNT